MNNTQFHFNNSLEDAFIWPDNKNGIYTTKSGYNWLLSHADPVSNINSSQSWSWIWKLKLPEKYKFLVWLACHDVVPTFSLLHHRNMVPTTACPRCGNHDETFLHCVRDCTHSINIWHHIGFTTLDFFTNLCAQDWLKAGLTGSHSNIFSAGIWWTWKHRNLTCLNNEVWSLHRLSFNIQNSTEVIKNVFSKNVVAVNSERLIKWNCLNFSRIILNVDESCLETPQRAGFGGLIRNSVGRYLFGFSGFISNSEDILLAELSAIYHGLSLARDMHIAELVCYTNSLLCIGLITGPTKNYHIYASKT